ncbi:hypothetical protein [Agromyces seonyuensis]|uniref:PH domain-containing protein n=1 Tax=Agromyces seonyuensis TaxID=2662446 RepID=A0A6I4NRG6_9MICO|nr:hypothetical protein [Agromyces seonyuensis]MWB97026.1 hypothetical protein [Agromyces seonyuensis]
MEPYMVVGAVVSIAIVVGAVLLMLRSWRRRVQRDEVLSAYPLPVTEGSATWEGEVLYVATTPAEDPIERLAISGLAFRGTARVRVEEAGVELRVAGEAAIWLPADRIVGAERQSWTIDRGVEAGGLVAITWLAERTGGEPLADGENAGPALLTSSLRAREERDASRLIDAVEAIASGEAPVEAVPAAADEEAAADAVPNDDTAAEPAVPTPAAATTASQHSINTESEA